MGKMTKRFGFSRSSGSNFGSNAIVGSDLMAANSLSGLAIVAALPWSASILRILLGDAPLTGVVAMFLRGLCIRDAMQWRTERSAQLKGTRKKNQNEQQSPGRTQKPNKSNKALPKKTRTRCEREKRASANIRFPYDIYSGSARTHTLCLMGMSTFGSSLFGWQTICADSGHPIESHARYSIEPIAIS